MAACPACGKENPEGARFCNDCATPLISESREQRKTVTVLFCDVTGSTALGESTDPEALRALLARYFGRMKGIVESHGGTVEKFIGDAVMAVFGVPVAHEDDALRACRAAVEMRDALPELGIRGRIGVNTGEVVTGTSERLATGDAVNVSARLEQTAEPGEVLVGESTFALVREAVRAEPVEPLNLKGKSARVSAYRLVSLLEAPERRHDSRFVGRERELDLIATAWVRAGAEQRCELVTVVAEAGVGKTRLAVQALDRLDARVVRGRCLSYGEGITYWPVVEVVKQLGVRPSDPAAARAIASLLGESQTATSAEEIAWAFRRLLEEQAPLVCVFEDIHWGEETFLDLVEHVALLSSGAQLLLLCTSRPELVGRRHSWPVTVHLAPLEAADVDRLVPSVLPRALREQIARVAGGNPLFVTEMVAMAELAGGEVPVPPNLRALLTARLDQIDEAERRVLERGAVEGEMFHRGAVQALMPDELQVTARLAGLVRRELVRPDRPQIPGEDGFRFRHLLIRDAAYESLPKAVRADLHLSFADWLEQHGRGLVELDEILGYHLEQAVRYQAELGQTDRALALRAGDHLLTAGRRALDRDDAGAARVLLERALSLTRPVRTDVNAELDLAQAWLDDPARAARTCEEAAVGAAEAGDETGAALARAMAVHYRLMTGPESLDELEALLLDARRRLEEDENHAGLAQVWWALGFGVANARGSQDDWATAALQARHHNRLAGRSTPQSDLGTALVCGSRPADEALEVIDRLLAETPTDWLVLQRAWLLAMLDRRDEAEPIAEEASARLRDQGGLWGEWILAEISALAGDYEDASNRLRTLCQGLETQGLQGYLESYLAMLGRLLCQVSRFDEAEQYAERARALEAERLETSGEAESWYMWRQVLARVYAYRGDLADAERLAREAVALGDRNDSLDVQCVTRWDLAEVLVAASCADEAAAAFEQALERAERKKNLALAAQVRSRLDALELTSRARAGD